MRIANVAARLVLVKDGRRVDVETASRGRFSAEPQAVYERWDEFVAWAASAEIDPAEHPVFDPRESSAPVPSPRQVFAVALNYREHAAEADEEAPGHPLIFTKFPTSLTGAWDEVRLPSDTVDWEVELVAVVGRRAHRVGAEEAWDYVAGLTIGQDLSERTVQSRPPVPQFSLGKSFPGFSPTGPTVVTIDEFDDPDDLSLSCEVGGEVLQSGRTSRLIFSVPQLIAEISAAAILLPGDLIFTGTPSGVGVVRQPQRFLKAGETLVSRVEGIGEMSNTLTESDVFAAHRVETAGAS